jgi:hypothetical protein
MLAGAPQDGMRTNNQDATQVPIALFGDRPELERDLRTETGEAGG